MNTLAQVTVAPQDSLSQHYSKRGEKADKEIKKQKKKIKPSSYNKHKDNALRL